MHTAGNGSAALAGLGSMARARAARAMALGDPCSQFEPVTAANSSQWLACMNANGNPAVSASAGAAPIQIVPAVATPVVAPAQTPTVNAPTTLPALPAGWTYDASGTPTEYTDVQLLNGINSIQYAGASAIPAEQISRIDPQVLAAYTQYTAITPGSVLAYMLGLGGSGTQGQVVTGSDNNAYAFSNGAWVLASSLQLGSGTQAGTATAVNNAPAAAGTAMGYQPSTDDLYVFASIKAVEPYTTAEIEFAKTIETYGSPVSSLFTAAALAALWNAYVSAGYSVTAVTQALNTNTSGGAVTTGAMISGGGNLPAGSFSAALSGYGVYVASAGQLYQVNSDGSATALGGFTASQITAAQTQAATAGAVMSGNVTTDASGDVLFTGAVLGAIETALGISAGVSTSTMLLLGGAAVAAWLLMGKK